MTYKQPEIGMTDKLSVSQLAQLLEINRTTITRHIAQGKLKCGYRKSNGRKFFTGAEVIRYFNAQY